MSKSREYKVNGYESSSDDSFDDSKYENENVSVRKQKSISSNVKHWKSNKVVAIDASQEHDADCEEKPHKDISSQLDEESVFYDDNYSDFSYMSDESLDFSIEVDDCGADARKTENANNDSIPIALPVLEQTKTPEAINAQLAEPARRSVNVTQPGVQ